MKGFVNDPRDCAAYFSCVGGNPFNVRCTPGFYFDESREVCDLPEFVNCNACPASGVASVRMSIKLFNKEITLKDSSTDCRA